MRLRNAASPILMLAGFIHPALSRAQDGEGQPSDPVLSASKKKTDFNRNIYYKNKLEFTLERGWLPINIPWPFDFLLVISII